MSGDLSLADYPAPFIGEDGTVNTAIVVGEQAATIDVVGAINIAGDLGNQAFTTEQVSAQSGSYGFTATQGVTLDTRNDQLYLGDQLDTVRQTLTEDETQLVETTQFSDDSGESTEIENYINVGQESAKFGNGADELDNKNPVVHVPLTSENSVNAQPGNHLFSLQANMDDAINMSSDDVTGEEIELFGQTFVVSESSGDNQAGDKELHLFGSEDTTTISTSGDSSSATLTIGGEEVTIGVDAVTGPNTAAITVNGQLREENEDETFNVNGETVRLSDIIQTNSDQSQGTVSVSVGSEELVIEDGQTIEDDDGNEFEGTYVEINGNSDYKVGDGVSSIEVYVGATKDDQDAVTAGESFSHPLFPSTVFRFGGLNPNVASGDTENSDTIEFTPSGNDEGQVEFSTESNGQASLTFVHDKNEDGGNGDLTDAELADSDGDQIVVREGVSVQEDEYFLSDAGDFSHVWEVTSIDRDTEAGPKANFDGSEEATIDLRDVNTGETVEVDIDVEEGASGANNDNDASGTGDTGEAENVDYVGSEVIDGQTYYFELDGNTDDGNTGVEVNYGDEASLYDPSGTVSAFASDGGTGASNDFDDYNNGHGYIDGAADLFAAVDTANRNAVTFYGPADVSDVNDDAVFSFPSTESTDDSNRVQFDPAGGTTGIVRGDNSGETSDLSASGFDEVGTTGDYVDSVGIDSAISSDTDEDDNSGNTARAQDFRVGNVVYTVAADGSGSLSYVALDADQTLDDNSGDTEDDVVTTPSTIVMEQEDDSDREDAYIVKPSGYNEDDGFSFSGGSAISYTGQNGLSLQQLESNDDLQQDITSFGTFVEQDTNEEGEITLRLPGGQAVVGAAFTGPKGTLERGGGAGSVESMQPTEFPEAAMLDSEVTSSQRQNTNHILVGGPAVNTLVADLAQANKTMAGSEYSQGDSMIQLVEDSFAQGANSLIVAGFSGEDTRQAANRLANADENPLPGRDRVMVGTGQ